MSYSQLSASERNQFYELRSATDLSMRTVARQLGRSQSTLLQELARNRSEGQEEEERARISHETIYQMIYADHEGLKDYQKYL
jgi:IS30 family transposase